MLTCIYSDFHALKNISMGMEKNTVTALIGPSGCGKSTYLRLFNRMNDLIDGVKITGDVLVDNEEIYTKKLEIDDLRKKVGMVFQKPNPFPKSIFENVAFGLRVNGEKNKTFIEERVERSFNRMPCWMKVKDKLKKSAFDFREVNSSVCVLHGIAIVPSFILMDEPVSALDP
jgi:phosphate transport system ATP-binding protein